MFKTLFTMIALVACAVGHAQTIELVQAGPHGGPSSFMAKLGADQIRERTGLDVMIAVRPGAEGKIGVAYATTSPTPNVLLMTSGVAVMNRVLDRKFEPNLAQYDIIAPVATTGTEFVVNSQSPIKNWRDFQQAAKTRPLVCGVTNAAQRAALLYIKEQLGWTSLEVLYQPSLAQQATMLLGGSLECAVEPLLIPIWYSAEHRNRWTHIATASDPAWPGVPQVQEVLKGFTSMQFWGFGVRRDLPEAQRKAIVDALNELPKSASFIRALNQQPGWNVATPFKPSGNVFVEREFKFWSAFVDRHPKAFAQ